MAVQGRTATGSGRMVRPFESRAPKLGVVKPFDGIRGVGVWLVMIHHAWAISESFSGYIDLFFVLSGFLITTLIFEERRNTGDVSLRNFYARRGVRLLPGLFAVLVIFWIPVAMISSGLLPGTSAESYLLKQVSLESLATLFYVHNIFFSPIFGSFQYMGQMWSLSLEEQFYLLGAIATYVCVKKGWVRPLAVGLSGFILFVWIARGMGHGGPGQFWFQRPDAIAVGVLLAIVHAEMPTELSPKGAKRLLVAGWVSFAAFVFAIFSSSKLIEKLFGFYVPFYPTNVAEPVIPDDATRSEVMKISNDAMQKLLAEMPHGNYWPRWGFALSSLSAAILCLAFVRLKDDFAVGRWLSGRMLGYFGVLSYVLYISHYQLFALIDLLADAGPNIAAAKLFVLIMLKLGAALVVGAALHKWVEKPATKRLRHRFTHQVAKSS